MMEFARIQQRCGRWSWFGIMAFVITYGADLQSATALEYDASIEPAVLEEVTVTAQKRTENLQSTPLSVSSISGDAIAPQPMANTADLARSFPGLLTGKSAFVGQTYLRGVGQNNGVPGVESPVAVYLDGVYLGASALAVFDLSNIRQIDLLRGPQGTLFGRNATGGLIQITTNEPSTQFGGSAEIGYGNFNTLTGRMYVTGEFASNLSSSLSFNGKNRQDGYLRNVTTGADLLNEKTYTVQNKWLLEVGDNTSIKLNLIHGDYRNLPGAIYGVYPNTLSSDGVTSYLGERRVANRNNGLNTSANNVASATVLTEFDWGRVSSQTSFVSFLGDLALNQSSAPGRPNPNGMPAQISVLHAGIQSWTEEFQVQAPEGADFQWIAGFFYLRDLTKIGLTVRLDESLLSFVQSRVATDSYSVFGQATKPLGDRAHVTVGLRYTRDTKELSGFTNTGAVPSPTLPPRKTWPKLTWRVAVDYQFSPELFGYVSYNRGFKSGTYTNTAVIFPPAAPETVDAYEVGLKAEPWGKRLRVNGAAFYYDYKDLQLRTVSGGTILTYNAANSRIYGVDVDVDAVVSAKLTLSAGFEALHARYTRFPNGPVNLPTPLPTIPLGCTGTVNFRNGGAETIACDLAGRNMVKAPPLSAKLGVQFETRLAGGHAVFRIQDRYSDRYFFEPDNFLKQRPYHWIDASVSWVPDRSSWKLTLWGTNLTDARVFGAAVTGGGSFNYAPGTPAMYGITANVAF